MQGVRARLRLLRQVAEIRLNLEEDLQRIDEFNQTGDPPIDRGWTLVMIREVEDFVTAVARGDSAKMRTMWPRLLALSRVGQSLARCRNV